ncbi:hypothetical protein [Actinoplanes regularis]|uniref:Uncharacterized protein n=1 Tax=Actinoplanes regularis TaxID=52697 RepID=A0A239DZT4_9ACTN|nr:hypothetical protein [Actinoplanes regularis]GIE88914.1 hypothetical protein Are01nite_53940 [Actinoplanes regularis]SNS37966.1 hypothetical protein SAMN06264365_114188 [Actinoplanes regularis]
MSLHCATRRYLIDRYDVLTRRYTERVHGDTNPEAKRIYPRYNLVADILDQVERLDPDNLPGMESLTGVLLRAAEVEQPSDSSAADDIEGRAVQDERERYRSIVRALPSCPDSRTSPLGYRRVLTTEESSAWRLPLRRRWGVEDGIWHPMLAGPVPTGVLVLTDAAVMHTEGAEVVRRALRGMGRQRVVELREYGADYLLDVEMFSPRYTGAEGLWTDAHEDWLAYASHEGTVAFGGALADAIEAHWPDLDRWRWHGWGHLGTVAH